MKKILTLLAYVAIAMTINAQTSDMKMMAVHGPVYRVFYTEGADPVLNADLVTFGRDNWITEIVPDFRNDPHDVAEIIRTSYNLMDGWRIYWSDNDYDDRKQLYEFSYGSNINVVKVSASFLSSGFDAEITWDATGRIKSIAVSGGAEMWEYTYVTIYEYTKTDKYGNWTEAKYLQYFKEIPDNDPDRVETSINKGKITRTIEYYE